MNELFSEMVLGGQQQLEDAVGGLGLRHERAKLNFKFRDERGRVRQFDRSMLYRQVPTEDLDAGIPLSIKRMMKWSQEEARVVSFEDMKEVLRLRDQELAGTFQEIHRTHLKSLGRSIAQRHGLTFDLTEILMRVAPGVPHHPSALSPLTDAERKRGMTRQSDVYGNLDPGTMRGRTQWGVVEPRPDVKAYVYRRHNPVTGQLEFFGNDVAFAAQFIDADADRPTFWSFRDQGGMERGGFTKSPDFIKRYGIEFVDMKGRQHETLWGRFRRPTFTDGDFQGRLTRTAEETLDAFNDSIMGQLTDPMIGQKYNRHWARRWERGLDWYQSGARGFLQGVGPEAGPNEYFSRHLQSFYQETALGARDMEIAGAKVISRGGTKAVEIDGILSMYTRKVSSPWSMIHLQQKGIYNRSAGDVRAFLGLHPGTANRLEEFVHQGREGLHALQEGFFEPGEGKKAWVPKAFEYRSYQDVIPPATEDGHTLFERITKPVFRDADSSWALLHMERMGVPREMFPPHLRTARLGRNAAFDPVVLALREHDGAWRHFGGRSGPDRSGVAVLGNVASARYDKEAGQIIPGSSRLVDPVGSGWERDEAGNWTLQRRRAGGLRNAIDRLDLDFYYTDKGGDLVRSRGYMEASGPMAPSNFMRLQHRQLKDAFGNVVHDSLHSLAKENGLETSDVMARVQNQYNVLKGRGLSGDALSRALDRSGVIDDLVVRHDMQAHPGKFRQLMKTMEMHIAGFGEIRNVATVQGALPSHYDPQLMRAASARLNLAMPGITGDPELWRQLAVDVFKEIGMTDGMKGTASASELVRRTVFSHGPMEMAPWTVSNLAEASTMKGRRAVKIASQYGVPVELNTAMVNLGVDDARALGFYGAGEYMPTSPGESVAFITDSGIRKTLGAFDDSTAVLHHSSMTDDEMIRAADGTMKKLFSIPMQTTRGGGVVNYFAADMSDPDVMAHYRGLVGKMVDSRGMKVIPTGIPSMTGPNGEEIDYVVTQAEAEQKSAKRAMLQNAYGRPDGTVDREAVERAAGTKYNVSLFDGHSMEVEALPLGKQTVIRTVNPGENLPTNKDPRLAMLNPGKANVAEGIMDSADEILTARGLRPLDRAREQRIAHGPGIRSASRAALAEQADRLAFEAAMRPDDAELQDVARRAQTRVVREGRAMERLNRIRELQKGGQAAQNVRANIARTSARHARIQGVVDAAGEALQTGLRLLRGR